MSDWEVISIYTRAQAIEDGVLVDVSELARVAGFKYPVAVTQGVWSECVRVAEEDKCTQDENGRLWDILNVLLFTIKGKKDNGDEVKFKVRVWKYEFSKPNENSDIDYDYVGFWRGHWRAFYSKDSRGENRKDHRGWNVVDYGRLGKDRDGNYDVSGYTWVSEHIKGDPALAQIKTRLVKHK